MTVAPEPMLLGWPLALALSGILAAERLRSGRRRKGLNQALHELRRPLQLLAMSRPRPSAAGGPLATLDLAIAALSQLDREINGGGPDARRLVSCRELVGGAVGRWRARAALGGGSIAFRWLAGEAPVVADPARLSQALDNLIVNALEHGGPHVTVEARSTADRLRIAVVDDGRSSRPSSRRETPAEAMGRLTGRGRNGHGLEIVRSVAAGHRGRFVLQRSDDGTVAVLELPLAGADAARVA